MKEKINFMIWIYTIILVSLISILIIFMQPSITLKGDEVVEIEYGDEYIEPGYIGTFILKEYTKKIKVKNNINLDKLGTYEVKYYLNINNFKTTKTRIVKIIDTEKPKIELIGNSYACPKKEYIEEGYKAIDNYDKDITDKVKINKSKDKITYSVLDSSKNKISIDREIIYKDEEKPVITINGNQTVSIYTGSNYNDLGATALDNCDDNITITTSGSVDTSNVGTYYITYTATDKSGNSESVTREVRVVNPNKDGQGKVIYLTFDDGPGPYTEQILNTLAKYNVKATFFVTNQFPAYSYLIANEHNQGHQVAVHTYSHNYGIVYSSVDSYINDFNRMNEVVKQYTGSYSNLFRFPGGSSNTISCSKSPGIVPQIASEMSKRGYVYFDWNLSSGDAGVYPTSTSVYNAVTNGVRNCSSCVVLMHDIKYATANALDSMLANLTSRGYTFATLNESSPTAHHSFGRCN